MRLWAVGFRVDAGTGQEFWSCWDGLNIIRMQQGHEFGGGGQGQNVMDLMFLSLCHS